MKNLFRTLAVTMGLIATVAFADVIQNDLLKLGQGSTGANKVLEFNTNDGASNKKLIINGSTKQGSLNVNEMTFGNGVAGDKKLIFDVGAGASNPLFKWDNASTKLQFTNDGTNFKNIGSGSGGAAGFSLIADDNADFEAGTASWTASGGSFTAITSGQAFGLQGGRFNASAASQTLSSALKTVVDGLKNQAGSASCYFKTTATDYKLQVFDGTNVLAEMTIAATSDYSKQGMVYTHPASGSVRLRVISASNAADLDIDNCFLGELEKGSVSQAALVASMYVPNNVSCNQSIASASLAGYGTQAGCPAPVVEYSSGIGTPSTADADSAVIFTINNLPPGTYVGVMETQAYNSGTAAALNFGLTDGTTQSGVAALQLAVNDVGPVVVSGVWTYTSSGNRTFQLLGANTAGGTNTLATNGALNNTHFKLYKYPTAPVETMTFDTIAWRVDANIGGANFSLGTSTQASYVEMTDPGMDLVVNTGSVDTQVACSGTNPSTGTTCAAGDESNGIAFSVPRAGTVLACASFSHYVQTTNGGVTFQIVETPNNAQTILQEGKSRLQNNTADTNDQVSSLRLCGTFKFDSAGQKTLRVMYEQALSSATNNQVLADRDSATGQRDIHWEVYPVDQQVPAPLLPNIVVSNSATPVRHEFVRIQNTGAACVITSQSGSWLTSVTRTGTGKCQLAITSGMFSATPSCQVTAEEPTSAVYAMIVSDTAPTSTNIHVGTSDAAGAFTDSSNISVHCSGLK